MVHHASHQQIAREKDPDAGARDYHTQHQSRHHHGMRDNHQTIDARLEKFVDALELPGARCRHDLAHH